jgi:hypothetical protein
MGYRVLFAMAILLGVWVGFGAPIVGIGLAPLQPSSDIGTFSDVGNGTSRHTEVSDEECRRTRPSELYACPSDLKTKAGRDAFRRKTEERMNELAKRNPNFDKDAYMRNLDDALSGGDGVNHEYRMPTRDPGREHQDEERQEEPTLDESQEAPPIE